MKKSIAMVFILLLCAGFLIYEGLETPQTLEPQAGIMPVVITPERRTHILYGDETGGGHFHTANKPCKSEFPEDWSVEKVIETISLIAANDNLNWRKERNGYHVAEQQVENLEVRVVLDENRQSVITGYPINVARNPCPANDP